MVFLEAMSEADRASFAAKEAAGKPNPILTTFCKAYLGERAKLAAKVAAKSPRAKAPWSRG